MGRSPQQVYPLALFFLLGIAALIGARYFLVPETFGMYGHYRAAAVDEEREQTPVYAGYTACGDCHIDVFEAKAHSGHVNLSCETCHGPSREHIMSDAEILPEIPRNREFCELCHGYNPARPSGFPQILITSHFPAEACLDCHDAHSPVIEHEGSCATCHREIATQKSVSHHASLECTRCHTVPDQHSNSPATVRAEKPTENAVCGNCHDRKADAPSRIPRIRMDEHAGRYLCWDCHYPHLPEASS